MQILLQVRLLPEDQLQIDQRYPKSIKSWLKVNLKKLQTVCSDKLILISSLPTFRAIAATRLVFPHPGDPSSKIGRSSWRALKHLIAFWDEVPILKQKSSDEVANEWRGIAKGLRMKWSSVSSTGIGSDTSEVIHWSWEKSKLFSSSCLKMNWRHSFFAALVCSIKLPESPKDTGEKITVLFHDDSHLNRVHRCKPNKLREHK